MRIANAVLGAENKRLKTKVARMKSGIGEFVIRHTTEKADPKTAELRGHPRQRLEMKTRAAETYPFILLELSPFSDENSDFDEASARMAVQSAAAILQ